MADLLPCPFCGGEAEVRPTYDRFTYQVDGWFAWCRNHNDYECPCAPQTMDYLTEADAVEAWNTRAERTCEVLGERYDELLDYWDTELSCGHVFNGMAQYVTYCPDCGAKVIP